MGAKSAVPNREYVVDVEGGSISARDVKAAREVAEEVMTQREFQRLADRITDEIRDGDSSSTRAARDRDRATPRDVSHVESARLRGDLPPGGGFRGEVSSRQRKIRSALKNQVMAAAPASQHQAINTLVNDGDAEQWRRINHGLHGGAGNAQALPEADRKVVQRVDRAIQSYERLNDRTHKVYVSVALPDDLRSVRGKNDLPESLLPGSRVTFDQFTVTRHNLHETPGNDSDRHVVFELVTSRGMYLGRSDSVRDTAHLLPRGMPFEVVNADVATYATASGGYNERLIVQLRECE